MRNDQYSQPRDRLEPANGPASAADWSLAVLIPIFVILAYLCLQFVFWRRSIYWSGWEFITFTGALPLLCLAIMACRPIAFSIRRGVILLVGFVAFSLSFSLIHNCVGHYHQWKPVESSARFSALLPNDSDGIWYENEKTIDSPFGPCKWKWQRIKLPTYRSRSFGYATFDLTHDPPEGSAKYLSWLTDTAFPAHGLFVRERIATTVDGRSNVRITFQSTTVPDQILHSLFVVDGKYACRLDAWSNSVDEGSREIQHFFDALHL